MRQNPITLEETSQRAPRAVPAAPRDCTPRLLVVCLPPLDSAWPAEAPSVQPLARLACSTWQSPRPEMCDAL